MKKLVVGILAHVDAGKTTLSEGMLYLSGIIGKLGRVDYKDAYLDTNELERARGITIFSKQALLNIGDIQMTLLDTPGHIDFSAEMERTLQVLDYAILVISGADGIQGHTKTLWRLLNLYEIPVFIFINKMDQAGTDKNKLLTELKNELEDSCIDFGQIGTEEFYDQLAMCQESMLEAFLESGKINNNLISEAVQRRKVFPCYFGSALKLEGVELFMEGLGIYSRTPFYKDQFGAKIYKIARDEQGNRLTYLKVTGGRLRIREVLSGSIWEEKVTQIRLYSGLKYETVNEIEAGSICAVLGLTQTRPGEGIGIEEASAAPVLEPVLSYQIILPEDCDPRQLIPKLRQLEEEEPELHILWDETLQEIQAQIMGEVQIEILQSLIESRFGVLVTFDAGRIVYKETIANTVEGVGHFEPLRHYAEVHLLLEPGEAGTGLEFAANCSEDILGKSWQRLVMTHLEERVHPGVLTGSAITDLKITLVSGRAHNKHTEGGDFREATYRGVRQGLKEADSILLEPYYAFQLELPKNLVGRAMNDIEKMHGASELTETNGEMAVLTGSAPVVTMRNYQREVTAYTKGLGRLFCSLKGYERCHNAEEVIESIGYDSERDLSNPTGSVFCSHGAGFLVDWDRVKEYMHLEAYYQKKNILPGENVRNQQEIKDKDFISLEEIDKIINSTYYANQGDKAIWKKRKTARESYYASPSIGNNAQKETKEEYLLVDGYNVVYAWTELAGLAEDNMDAARIKLLDALSNYQGIRKCHIIVVFDAYRVLGHKEEIIDYHNIHMVYTREAQTADQYIERFAHDNRSKYRITVATSDGLQQIIIRGAGSELLSARELKEEIERANERLMAAYTEMQQKGRSYLLDSLSPEIRKRMEDLISENENKNKE